MGSRSSLLAQTPLTFPALVLPDICPYCQAHSGLCSNEFCRRAVLPQLARPPIVRLMGEVHVEQKSRQTDESLPVSTEQAEWRKRKEHTRSVSRAKSRKHARSVARSRRRGLFGLSRKIAGLDS